MRQVLPMLVLLALVACGPAEQSKTPAGPAHTQAPAEIEAAIAALPAPYSQADYSAGRRVFAQCRSCHTIDAGAPNRVGPNLHGVFGREVGSIEDFTYSQAVRDADFTWDAAQLDHWLANPQTFLPGNRMAFIGVRDETQRRDLIAYLMVESESDGQ